MDLVKVTQEQLFTIAQEKYAVYGGSTDDPERRAREHSREGYSGKMFYADTKNMMQAEDRLLRTGNFRYNIQGSSNADQSPGYVYVIKGVKHTK